jgi:hypothetical protein
MKTTIVFAAVLCLPVFAFPAVIKVPDDYSTIQEGIDAAVNGDTVLVAPGTYMENIDFLGKAITVKGEEGADFTFIDGNQAGNVAAFKSGEGLDSVLEGFTLFNGKAQNGGGMHIKDSSATVIGCTFKENSAYYGLGGGLYCRGGSPELTDCTFSENLAEGGLGGGMYGRDGNPTLTGCDFEANTAGKHGGGMYSLYASPALTDCTFSKNTAGSDWGGGMYSAECSLTLTGCAFIGNTAELRNGGGMYNESCDLVLTDCLFEGNAAVGQPGSGYGYGGGMYNAVCTLEVTACTFLGNLARRGSGMDNSFSSATVIDCLFDGNSAAVDDQSWSGGGMHNWKCDAIVTACTFKECEAALGGGGMANFESSPLVTECHFEQNSAINGGGMINAESSSPIVTRCTFIGNAAKDVGAIYGAGGGMYNGGMFSHSSDPTVIDCLFLNNAADQGGGMYNDDSDPTVTACIFSGNSAEGSPYSYGGGMRNVYCDPKVTSCIFQGNSADIGGGGMANSRGNPMVANAGFIDNTADHGGGLHLDIASATTVINTIFWSQGTLDGPEIWIGDIADPSTLHISFSDVEGGQSSVHVEPGCTLVWGSGMIDSDPLFVDPVNGDFHLTFNSPCRGSGDNSAVMELTDFEGDPRIAQGTVDMGADEFYTHLYCTGDFTPGGSIEGKFVGLPGTSPVGLFLGFGVLDPPVPTAWGSFFLQPPVALIPLIPIPGDGVLVLPATIPATPPAPYDLPMQALIGLGPDSLTNLFVLEVR